jgi:hypothetical protein
LYTVLVIIGVITLNKFLLSFELLLIVTAPTILFLLILNGWRYFNDRESMDLALLVTWLWLGIIIAGYFLLPAFRHYRIFVGARHLVF